MALPGDITDDRQVAQMAEGGTYDLTPKHHIRSPIIEETESSIEAELMRSRGEAGGFPVNVPLSDRFVDLCHRVQRFSI